MNSEREGRIGYLVGVNHRSILQLKCEGLPAEVGRCRYCEQQAENVPQHSDRR